VKAGAATSQRTAAILAKAPGAARLSLPNAKRESRQRSGGVQRLVMFALSLFPSLSLSLSLSRSLARSLSGAGDCPRGQRSSALSLSRSIFFFLFHTHILFDSLSFLHTDTLSPKAGREAGRCRGWYCSIGSCLRIPMRAFRSPPLPQEFL